jgi:hypothetical protein
MVSKSIAAPRRLSGWIDIRRKTKTLVAALDKTDANHRPKLNFANPAVRRFVADLALRLEDGEPLDQPIHDAFKAFELDPTNPFDWRRLLFYLADCHYGKRRGAPKRWNEERWCRLLVDYYTVKFEFKKQSDEAVCKHLQSKKPYREHYANLSPPTIRRNLIYARDPTKNKILGKIMQVSRERAERVVGDAAKAEGRARDPQDESEVERLYSQFYAEDLLKTVFPSGPRLKRS